LIYHLEKLGIDGDESDSIFSLFCEERAIDTEVYQQYLFDESSVVRLSLGKERAVATKGGQRANQSRTVEDAQKEEDEEEEGVFDQSGVPYRVDGLEIIDKEASSGRYSSVFPLFVLGGGGWCLNAVTLSSLPSSLFLLRRTTRKSFFPLTQFTVPLQRLPIDLFIAVPVVRTQNELSFDYMRLCWRIFQGIQVSTFLSFGWEKVEG
jgi:hypothetical protein